MSLIVTQGGVQSFTAQAAEIARAKSAVTAEIYPKPQNITFDSAERMHLEGTVEIVMHDQQAEATLPKLKEILEREEIAYQVTDSLSSGKAAIFITSNKNHCNICSSVTDSENVLGEAPGYLFVSDDSVNSKGQVINRSGYGRRLLWNADLRAAFGAEICRRFFCQSNGC